MSDQTHPYMIHGDVPSDTLKAIYDAYEVGLAAEAAIVYHKAVKKGVKINRIGTHRVSPDNLGAWVYDPESPSGSRSLEGWPGVSVKLRGLLASMGVPV